MTMNKQLREFGRAFVHGASFAFLVGITIGAILFLGMVL